MSAENVAVVRAMWEAFLRDDAEAALGVFDPDVEWDGTNLPDGKVSRGISGVVDHVTRWAEMWETWDVELEDVIDAGDDRVIAFIRERGTSKAGLEVNERHSELYTVRGGKITYRKGFSAPTRRSSRPACARGEFGLPSGAGDRRAILGVGVSRRERGWASSLDHLLERGGSS